MENSYYKKAVWYFLLIMVLCLGISMTANATSRFIVHDNHMEAEGTIIWNGFHHIWKKTPHRLNKFGSYFRNIEYDDGYNELVGERRSLFKVGAFNDTGTVKIKGQFIKSSYLGIHEGYVKENCLKVSGKMGQSATVRCHKSINLAKIGFEEFDQVTVILRGFQLTEISYSSGFNTRGFAIRVIPIDHNAETFDFDVLLSVHPEHAPDRPLPSWLPLGDDCGKCDSYTYAGRIYYTVIGISNENGNLIDARAKGTNFYSQYVKMFPNKTPSYANTELMETVIVGLPGYDHGIIALQGFKWQLKSWKKNKKRWPLHSRLKI